MSALRLAALIVAVQFVTLSAYMALLLFVLWGHEGLVLPIAGALLVVTGAAWVVLRRFA